MVKILSKKKKTPQLEDDVFGIVRLFRTEEGESLEVDNERLSVLVVTKESLNEAICLDVKLDNDDESEDELLRQLFQTTSEDSSATEQSQEEEENKKPQIINEEEEERVESPQPPSSQDDEDNDGSEEAVDVPDVETLMSYIMPLTSIKSVEDKIPPIYHIHFFTTPFTEANEIKSSQETVERAFDAVVDNIPPQDRDNHFKAVDLWQSVPSILNEHFQTDLMDLDSARMYEALVVCSKFIFPTPPPDTCTTHNLCFLCLPASGIVAGMKLFTDLTCPHVKLNWTAYTRHPIRERDDMEQVTLNDHALFWEPSRWKFILNDEVSVVTNEEVERLVNIIKTDYRQGLDILVADLCVGKIQSTVTYEQFDAQLHAALLNEAGQINVALKTLKTGGTLMLSVVNVIEPITTIGNLRLLAGLFSRLWIVPTRPSSTWVRNTMVVCSGYTGGETFNFQYPDLYQTHLSSIQENLKSGEKVFLNLASFPPNTQEKLKTLSDFLALESRVRTTRFVMSYLEGYENQTEKQQQIAEEWFDFLKEHVTIVREAWGVFKNVRQPATPTSFQELQGRFKSEHPVDEKNIIKVLHRLCVTYGKPHDPPTPLNAIANNVSSEETTDKEAEATPKVILFTRFAPLEIMHDRLVAREIAKQIPSDQLLLSRAKEPCDRHAAVDVWRTLTQNNFQIERKQLIVACARLSVQKRLGVVDAGMYMHVVTVLLDKLNKLLRDDCFYVCHFPLWTRFLLGLFCIAKSCFLETRLIITDCGFVGILFIKFRGFRNNDVKTAVYRIKKIKQHLDIRMVMEVVPLESIMSCLDLGDLMQYNEHLIRSEVQSMVNIFDLLGFTNNPHDE